MRNGRYGITGALLPDGDLRKAGSMIALIPIIALLGRLLLSAIFLISGIGKMRSPEGDGGQMRAKGMPAVPILLPIAAIVEVLGGISVLLGFHARIGSAILFLYLIPV